MSETRKRVQKLLEQMARSKTGWKAEDLETLYTGFGFEKREGGKHVVYSHPEFPQLRATVTRARNLPQGYIQEALRLISELKKLQEQQE